MKELPDLPKKYKRIEAKVDSLVAEKVANINKNKNWALEVKIKGGRLKKHQSVALKQVENGTFAPYKLRDMGQISPFDFFYLGDADAIVCVVDGRHVECEVNGGVIKYKFRI